MPKLYSYVVQHDYGLSPNPSGGFCTLAFCKFKRKKQSRKPNVVELANVNDWVIGTGGMKPLSVGHGKLVYAMRVTEKLTLPDYFSDSRFVDRDGNDFSCAHRSDRFALVSGHFYYFGASAPEFAQRHLKHPIEKSGPAFRSDFSEDFIDDFVRWLERHYDPGIGGKPCAEHEGALWAQETTCSQPKQSRPRCQTKC